MWSTQFHDALPACEALLNGRPLRFKSTEQCCDPAVADSHPERETRIAVAVREVKEVHVLGDDDPVFSGVTFPNFGIRRDVEAEIEHMNGVWGCLRTRLRILQADDDSF